MHSAGMILNNDLRRRWHEGLRVDGSTPPLEITLRCISLLGEPDLVLTTFSTVAEGTRWQVVASTGTRLLTLKASSAEDRWTWEEVSQRQGMQITPVSSEIEATVRPLGAVISVDALPDTSRDEYFHPYRMEGDGLEQARGGWRIHFRDGSAADLGPGFAYPPTSRAQGQASEAIVARILDYWDTQG